MFNVTYPCPYAWSLIFIKRTNARQHHCAMKGPSEEVESTRTPVPTRPRSTTSDNTRPGLVIHTWITNITYLVPGAYCTDLCRVTASLTGQGGRENKGREKEKLRARRIKVSSLFGYTSTQFVLPATYCVFSRRQRKVIQNDLRGLAKDFLLQVHCPI